MKTYFKNTPFAIAVLIIGVAVVVAGILTMALYHDMSWQSYVIIGVIMLCAIWAMFNIPLSTTLRQKAVPVRHNERRQEEYSEE